MHDYIGIHFSELALKGQNRPYFRKKLRDNIKKALKGQAFGAIENLHDRILIKLSRDSGRDEISGRIKNIFGVSHFYFACSCKKTVESIREESGKLFSGTPKSKTFKVAASRSDKEFPVNSMELNRRIGEFLYNQGYKVDIKKPDITLYIDVIKHSALVYTEKVRCQGGLPVGSSGKVVVLFSGGIDSPVAAWYAMRRGCRPVYVHFHALRNNKEAMKSKIGKLIETLNKYSRTARVYLVPYDIFQLSSPGKNELVLFRRFINRIAERIAEQEGAKALVTGESVGQVASQTLDNINAIEEAVKIAIIRPLAGFTKEEIIDKAKEIGTFELSIQDYKDCCSIISRHPKTKAKLDEIKREEERMNIEKLLEKTMKNIEVVSVKEKQ